jgi:hypothetical protein
MERVSTSFGLYALPNCLSRSPVGRRKVCNSRDYARYLNDAHSLRNRSRKYLRSRSVASSLLFYENDPEVFLGTGGM